MRIQILELPAEQLGEASTTPFVLVVDKHHLGPEEAQAFAASVKDWGARGALFSDEDVEIA